MFLVVGVLKNELSQLGELTLDAIQPGCIGRRVDQSDTVFLCPVFDTVADMWGEIIQDQEDPLVLGIALAEPFQDIQHLPGAFASADVAP